MNTVDDNYDDNDNKIIKVMRVNIERTSTRARVLRLGDSVGLTPLAAIISSGVLF